MKKLGSKKKEGVVLSAPTRFITASVEGQLSGNNSTADLDPFRQKVLKIVRETFEGGEGVPVQDEVADVDDSLVKMSDIADEDFSEDSDDEDSEDDTSTSTRSERGGDVSDTGYFVDLDSSDTNSYTYNDARRVMSLGITPRDEATDSGYAEAPVGNIHKNSAYQLAVPKEEDKKEKKDKKKDKKEKKERKRARAKTKAKAQKKNAKKFDWNNKFRGTLAKVEAFKVDSLNKGDLNERIEAIEDLVYLGQDFIYSAHTYGKIIISEVHLPVARQTIKPTRIGGIAGGAKYVVHGILFKFAVDSSGLFGGDDAAAAKVAGHELKGLISYFNLGVESVGLPLMALVDFRGFRVIAMSLLPVGPKTLIYGSADGGKTVLASNSKFNIIMKQSGRRLNLAPHICGRQRSSLKRLWSAADVEGHLGLDGQFYLLDFSRTLPPTHPDPKKRLPHLYEMFRSEFVEQYTRPLCSDSYSGFIVKDPAQRDLNNVTDEASKHLEEDIIPLFAKEFSGIVLSSKTDVRITEEMHSKGINMRYLGLVFKHVMEIRLCPMAGYLILLEGIFRVLKRTLRLWFRESVKALQIPLEIPYHSLVVKILNSFFSSSPSSLQFWEKVIVEGLEEHFHFTLVEKELLNISFALAEEKPKGISTSEGAAVDEKKKKKRSSKPFGKDHSMSQTFEVKSASKMSHGTTGAAGTTAEQGSETPEKTRRNLGGVVKSLVFAQQGHQRKVVSQRLIGRFFEVMSVVLSQSGREKLKLFEDPSQTWNSFELLDVEHVGGRVKHMNIVALAKGQLYFLRGEAAVDPIHKQEFYQRAINEFTTVLSSSPTNQHALLLTSQAMIALVKLGGGEVEGAASSPGRVGGGAGGAGGPGGEEKAGGKLSMWDSRVARIDNYLGRLTRFHPKFSLGQLHYARFLMDCDRKAMAEQHFLRGLEANPTSFSLLFEYGQFLTLCNTAVMGRQFLLYASKAKESPRSDTKEEVEEKKD